MATERQPLNTWSWGNSLQTLLRAPFIPRDFRRPYGVPVIARAEFFGTAGGAVLVTVGVIALTLSTFAPTVTVSDHKTVIPSTAAVILTPFVPSVTIGVTITPSVATLSTSTFAPTVSTPRLVTPSIVSLTITTFIPTITTPRVVTPPVVTLALATYVPAVTASTGGGKTVNQRARNLLIGCG